MSCVSPCWPAGSAPRASCAGLQAAAPEAEITVIGNTGDDISLFGLHVSPDLDTVMYTLGGGISEDQGWGRAGETFTVLAELAAYGVGAGLVQPRRPRLRHPHRQDQMLAGGQPLSARPPGCCASAGSPG